MVDWDGYIKTELGKEISTKISRNHMSPSILIQIKSTNDRLATDKEIDLIETVRKITMAIIKRENDPDDEEDDPDRIDRLMQEGKEHRNDKEYWKSKYGLDIEKVREVEEDGKVVVVIDD